MGAPAKGDRRESGRARLLGSATAGVLELFTFHPIDTIAKRLMNNQKNIFVSGRPFNENMSTLRGVIFKDAASAGTMKKYFSLFPGLGFAAGYKICQRIYKFGGQPFVNDYLQKHYRDEFQCTFGAKYKPWMQATAGSIIGIGEIVLLPLDVLKIIKQTNPESVAGKGFLQIVAQEKFNLYRGAGWTACRNAPGSFALFGGSAFVKEHVFQLKDYSNATFFQNFCSSIGGAVASIVISQPLDVIKTRIQSKAVEGADSGTTIIKNMVKNEGLTSFFKGVTPKVLVVGPKLIFSFTIAQQMIPYFHKMLEGEKAEIKPAISTPAQAPVEAKSLEKKN